jgi:cytochrome P450
VIACRFSVLCFAAIQSSVITLTNAIFDLAASPDGAAAVDAMRAEALRETSKPCSTTVDSNEDMARGAAASAVWDKAALARMRRVDSALRESLRLHGFVERGVMKLVVAPGGVTLPDGQTHLPRGTKVGVSGYSVHHDSGVYPDAGRYEPFRFAGTEGGEARPLALVKTSERFMGFSHGSHAW